ncbi:molybdenum cofactor guanylyltransferase [Halobium salinum]|uniref:Probable molybdenum cofactor guanylyltransferase n=1 Tax=Halobium salinum TaxID=1364940 RepID=A0ABD5PBL2_9EURY|nr:molybdenum cofactor guanylyltransferase [Halobium salinum]
MNADTGRTGVVVAGGRSSRFAGADKALARLEGTPLIRHVVDDLAPAVDEVVVNCRGAQRDALEAALSGFEVRFAEDRIHDRGPLAGVRSGLRAARGKYAALVACDMPHVPASLLSALFEHARHRTGAAPRVDEVLQPFPAVVHVRAGLDACREAFTRHPRSMREFLDSLDPVAVPERVVGAFVTPDAFANVNTRADLRAATERR